MAKVRSLRLKLTLGITLAFLALQVGLAAVVVTYQRDSMERTNLDLAEEHVARMADSLVTLDGDWSSGGVAGIVPDGSGITAAVVRRPNGTVVSGWRPERAESLPFTAWETVPSGPLGPVFSRLGEDTAEPELVITQPFRMRGEAYYLQAVLPADHVSAPFGTLGQVAVILAPLLLGLGLLLAWRVALQAVQPLERIREAARSVSPERLGQRIQLETADREVASLQAELNRALERLEEGYRAQEEFLGNVSHELRTPIAVMRAEAEVMSRTDPSDPELRTFVTSVMEEMKRLGNLIESLLSLTRLEMARELVSRERVDARDLVLESVQHCGGLARTRDVRLVPHLPDGDDETQVEGDEALLGTVLDNLVRNAVRFSPEGEAVEIALERAGAAVRITVSDRGPGIPPDQVERLFRRGARGDEGSDTRGLGVGLAIARSITRLHGGALRVSRDAETGCAVILELPDAKSSR